MDQLSKRVRKMDMPPADRLGLLNERFQLAKAGYTSTVSALRLLDDYDNENHATVWELIAGQLGAIRKTMDSDDLDSTMKPYLRELTQLQVDRLGWASGDKESHFDKLLRPLILATASFADNQAVVDEAVSRFEQAAKPEDLMADLRGPVLGTIARRGQAEDFDKILKWYKQSNNAQVRSSLAGALGSFKDQSLIDQCLALVKSEHVRLQEVLHWLSFLFGNREAKHLTWKWLTNNWDWLGEKFGSDIMTFMYFPRMAGNAFSETDFIKQYDQFFGSVKTKGIKRSVAQGRESIVWQSGWRQRDQQAILKFFKDWNSN